MSVFLIFSLFTHLFVYYSGGIFLCFSRGSHASVKVLEFLCLIQGLEKRAGA